MKRANRHLRTGTVKALSLFLAFAWVASDAALADQSRAGSSRSGARSNSGSSSGSSGSVSKGSSRSSSSSSGASRRSAVSRSGSSSRGSAGAARTRPHGGSASQNRHHGGSHHGSRYYGGHGYSYGFGYYGYPRYWNPLWGFWGYGPGYGYGYGYYPPVVHSNHRGYRMGALDLDVRPKSTEIYVDGQYIGLAKQYDGFPGHLWLERGVYEISFYKPGFETQSRTVKILTDLILDIEISMPEGQAVKPEMRLEAAPREEDEYVRRSRPRRERASAVTQSRMHLEVEPGNAVIYLDGNLLGTGDELAGLHAGLILSAGAHTLEVSRDGFETVEERIFVEPGEEVDLAYELKPLARAGL